MDLGGLLMLGLIAVLILGPRETRRMAHKMGKWMHDLRRMSGEFTSELKREADLVELTEGVRSFQNTIGNVKKSIRDAALGDMDAPKAKKAQAAEAAEPVVASEIPAAQPAAILVGDDSAAAEPQKVSS